MDLGLAGKTAIVTGASGDIGAACVALLAREGVRVHANGRDADRLRALDAEIVAGDLTDDVTIDRLASVEPDLLIHVAGHRFGYAKLHTADLADAASVWRVDYESFARLSARCIPTMMSRRFGRVVAVTSLVARMSAAGSPTYVAVKSAIEGLVRAIAVDYGRYGITANAVAPGFVMTSRLASRMAEENRARFENATSTKRLARPEDIAAPVAFLCSRGAASITGATLAAGGGLDLNNLW